MTDYKRVGGGAGNASSGNGLPSTYVSKTAAYTAAVGEFVECDTTSAGFTVTLPANPAVGALVAVKRVSSDANTLTIVASGTGTIDGDPNATTTTKMAGAVFEHKGSDVWRIAAAMTVTGPAGPQGPTGPQGPAGTNGAISQLQDEGANLTVRPTINFVGAGVTATDDSANSRTLVTIPGGSGGVQLGEAFVTKLKTGGYWYTGPFPSTNQNNGTAAGYCWFHPLDQQGVTIDRIAVNVTTGAASSVCRLGIYNDATGLPGTLLVDFGVSVGTVDSSTTGFKSLTVSQALPAGRVWLAVATQGGAPSLSAANPSMQIPGSPLNVTAGAAQPDRITALGATYRINGGITGALPATAYSTAGFVYELTANCVFIRTA